jgi:hypothetical protein
LRLLRTEATNGTSRLLPNHRRGNIDQTNDSPLKHHNVIVLLKHHNVIVLLKQLREKRIEFVGACWAEEVC